MEVAGLSSVPATRNPLILAEIRGLFFVFHFQRSLHHLSIEPEDLPLNPDGTLLQIKVLPPAVWPLSDAALAVCDNCRSYLHMNRMVSICPYLRNLASKLLYFEKFLDNLVGLCLGNMREGV